MNVIFKHTLIVIAIILFASCKKDAVISEADIIKESARVNEFLEARFQARVDRQPEFQTRLGIKKDADKWNDISPELAAAVLEGDRIALNWMLDSINPIALNKATKLSYDLYKQKLENNISDFKFRLYKYPVEQMHGMQSEIPAFLINTHQVNSVKDAEDYIARLHGLKPLFEQLVINLKEQQEAGILLPKFVFELVIRDSKNIISGAPFDDSNNESALLTDISTKIEKLKIKSVDKDKLYDAAVSGLLEGVLPAYEILIEVLKAQQEVATTDDGVWKFPDADSFFKMKLQRTTTTDLTSEEIHQIGLEEVARIHEEMKTIKEQVGFEGSLQDFFEFMRTDKQFYYPDTEQGRKNYLEKAVRIIDSMKTRLDELFIVKPKADIYVKAVESFREK